MLYSTPNSLATLEVVRNETAPLAEACVNRGTWLGPAPGSRDTIPNTFLRFHWCSARGQLLPRPPAGLRRRHGNRRPYCRSRSHSRPPSLPHPAALRITSITHNRASARSAPAANDPYESICAAVCRFHGARRACPVPLRQEVQLVPVVPLLHGSKVSAPEVVMSNHVPA